MARTAKNPRRATKVAPPAPTPRTGGFGTVHAPGTLPPPSPALKAGTYRVKILSVDPENGYYDDGRPVPSTHQMVKCVYPDGYEKNHQVKDVNDLIPRIITNVKGRHGQETDVAVSKITSTLKAGRVIEVEVK